MAGLDPVVLTAILGASGAVSLLLTIAKIRLDKVQVRTLQDLVKSMSKVIYTYDHEVTALRREVESLRREMGAGAELEPAKIELERQRIAQREREAEWRRMRDIAKALGWALDGRLEGPEE